MSKIWSLFRWDVTKLVALAIAILFWALVRGQGVGSLNIDVPLQVQGLPADLMIINDLPNHVQVTVSGPQTRLSELNAREVYAPLNASGISEPGVKEEPLNIDNIKLAAGLKVDRVQPDRVVLQIDRLIEREINIEPRVAAPSGWFVRDMKVVPSRALLRGPEVWLDALGSVKTPLIRLNAKPGFFEKSVGVESPAGKAIRLVNPDAKFKVRGSLQANIAFDNSSDVDASIAAPAEKNQPSGVELQ
ncbi:MAG: YbbR-like domain-containing protein [Mariprofundaceae bacterium]